MPTRRIDSRFFLLFAAGISLTIVGAAVVSAMSSPGAPRNNATTVSANDRPTPGAPENADVAATTQPSLAEILQAADALNRAGKLPQAPQPSLMEILQAADALNRAGMLPEPPQPSLMEILQAADALNRAGKLPPAPGGVVEPASIAPDRVQLPQAQTAPPAGSQGWYDVVFSARIRELVNQQRARNALGPLQADARLESAASGYAQVMATSQSFRHDGPDGSTMVDRVVAAGFPFTVQLGEVLAWGTDGWTPDEIVQAWMESPTHRAQILERVYRLAGVSCYFTPDANVTAYCVIDFAG